MLYYYNLMSSQIHYYDNTDINKIKIGKSQFYNDKYLFPLYYPNEKTKDKNCSFIIKTPRLFIPQKICMINNKYFLKINFLGIEQDSSIENFRLLIKNIEIKIKKQLYRRKKYKLDEKEFLSIIKYDNYRDIESILLPINILTSECYDINNYRIENWKFDAPTYGFFVIQFQNIWIKDDRWGININIHGALVLPSQIVIPPVHPDVRYIFSDEQKQFQIIKDHEIYGKFFKMKKMGIPNNAIKQKIRLEGFLENIIDYNENTLLKDIPELNNNHNNHNIPIPPPIEDYDNKSITSFRETDLMINKNIKTNINSINSRPTISIDDLSFGINSLRKIDVNKWNSLKSLSNNNNNNNNNKKHTNNGVGYNVSLTDIQGALKRMKSVKKIPIFEKLESDNETDNEIDNETEDELENISSRC
jgi:hypothetical protein